MLQLLNFLHIYSILFFSLPSCEVRFYKMSEDKRARKSFTMAFKARCILESDQSKNVTLTATKNKIARRQLQKWRANRDEILGMARKGKTSRSRSVGPTEANACRFPELEAKLLDWLKEEVVKK